ncbi:MAG: Gfo/Idh/MocA family oxidoreductase [Lentisphaeria bacterium]|nr:Gfo/Idh/MocA family oxidoreductase [Lentisphaeria bacterium]
MDYVKIGVIGIGNMGSSHVKFIGEMKNGKVTAVCDINPDAFKRIDEKVRANIACFTNSDEFFAKADVDLVIIAVPHYDHVDLAIKAMEAGKHIIVEKPISVHKLEAERLIAEAKKYPNLKKSLMFNQRIIPAHQKIKKLIDNGELGKITRVNWIITDWFRSQKYYDSGDWRASWRGEGGGVLINQCPHQLDLMQWFFGLPCKVRAAVKFGKYHDIEVEDEVNAYLEYADGKVGNFIASTGEMPGTNRLEITAEKGRLVYENGKIEFIRNEVETSTFCKTTKKTFGISDNWKCEIPAVDDRVSKHRQIIENVANAILKDTPLVAPMEEGIRGLELGNSMLLSGLLDKTIELPIDSKVFAAELEKLIAASRYVKKTVVQDADNSGFANSFH